MGSDHDIGRGRDSAAHLSNLTIVYVYFRN